MTHQEPAPAEPGKHDSTLALQFYATLMGGRVEAGPPPADSVLGWLLAHPDATPDDLGEQWRLRGVLPAQGEGWAWENPRMRRPHDERED